MKEIAILVTEDGKEFSGAEGVLSYHVKRLEDVCPQIKVVPFFVCRGRFPQAVEDFSAYLITGAQHSVNRKTDWMVRLEDFIRQVKKKPHIRMLGICFGHQLVAKALGGVIGKNPSGEFIWRCNKVDVTKEFAAKQYYLDANLGASGFHIMQSHEDQILKKPLDGKVMGGCQDCRYEVLLYGNNILTLQGHPEAESKKMLTRLPMLEKNNILTKEQIKNAQNSFDNDEADNTTRLIINFLTASSI